MEHGIVAYAAYVPRHRLAHEELGGELGVRGGDGRRVIASYDEDTTTMAVEAARRARGQRGLRPGRRSTSRRPRRAYLDKTNATAIHAALDLGHDGFAVDSPARRASAVGALRAAAATGGLAVLADIVTGRPARPTSATAATARRRSCSGRWTRPRSQFAGQASATAEFLDRWRLPGEIASRTLGGALRARDVHCR